MSAFLCKHCCHSSWLFYVSFWTSKASFQWSKTGRNTSTTCIYVYRSVNARVFCFVLFCCFFFNQNHSALFTATIRIMFDSGFLKDQAMKRNFLMYWYIVLIKRLTGRCFRYTRFLTDIVVVYYYKENALIL